MTIPDLFERVAAKVPEVRPTQLNALGGELQLAVGCVDATHAALWVRVDESTMPLAHMLIEAACWRLLPGYRYSKAIHFDSFVTYHVWDKQGLLVESGDELAEALLLAVEQVYGEQR